MEFCSPIYELLYVLESRGKIHSPRAFDLMAPEDILAYIMDRTGVNDGSK